MSFLTLLNYFAVRLQKLYFIFFVDQFGCNLFVICHSAKQQKGYPHNYKKILMSVNADLIFKVLEANFKMFTKNRGYLYYRSWIGIFHKSGSF